MTSPKLLYTLEQPHGLGELYFLWQKGESRSLLATTGTDATVAVHDRSGQLLERIKLPGLCAGMEWDNDGDYLAIITPVSNSVTLWECHTNKKENIETGLREPPSCLAWAYGEPYLAIGTTKGNLVLYNHHSTKRVPIIGKHTKRITSGVWNKDNVLVLASEDKTLSVSNLDGDTIRMISLRDIPNDLQISEMKTDERVGGENTISLIVGKRTLYLFNLLNPENPIELAFQQRYGSIVSYKWYGDGYILIGFSAGYVIAISTHIKEVGEELFQAKNHMDSLTDIAVCQDLAASCGDGQLKLLSLWQGGEVSGSVRPGGGAERCGWSADGRLLATAGRSALAVYVTALPAMFAPFGTRLLTLTSLNEVTLYQCVAAGDEPDANNSEARPLASYQAACEPEALALGAAHACCAAGALAWFHPLGGGAPRHRRYPASVRVLVAAGDHAAALFDGRAMLHAIEPPDPSQPERDAMLFPEPHMQGAKITDIQLTPDFFVFVTDQGHIELFSIEEFRPSTRHHVGCGLARAWVDVGGARVAALDVRARLHVYHAAAGQLCTLTLPGPTVKSVIWDMCLSERDVLVVWAGPTVHTYHVGSVGHAGAHADHVCATHVAHTPAALFAGELYCVSDGGGVVKLPLDSHHTAGLADADVDKRLANQKLHIDKLLLLRKFSEAWLFCDAVDEEPTWRKLGEAAMADLNVEFAIRVYTRLSDVAMVWALEDALHIEELPILCGTMCAYLGLPEAAARWLESASGAGGGAGVGGGSALALLAAAGQWERAADVARAHAPHRLPALLYAQAQHLHLTAEYEKALACYESSLITSDSEDPKVAEHNARCEAGVARAALAAGQVARGVAAALRLRAPALLRECARALRRQHAAHAATLYEHAGDAEHAAALYITLKSWPKVEALLPLVASPAVHLQYARAKEAEGRYRDALDSYLRAQDYESAIRLNLDKLEDVDEAVNLVQETKSVQGAKMVANYFQNSDDPSLAIKFLVMSMCYDEAFQLARKNGKLRLYGEILIQTSQARPEDFKSLALHFEGEKNHLLAGKFYFHAGEYKKAMSQLLKAGGTEDEENEAITVAIDAAAASDDERLTRRLIEFLLGETDGTPRDPKHLFRLYMAKKQYLEAAKTAVIIARAECEAGRYRAARDILRGADSALRAGGGPGGGGGAGAGGGAAAPRDLRLTLQATHSYILVRSHVRRGRHELAARLLQRITADLSYFPVPQHQVSLLTSAVLECARAGLPHAALRCARALMQPPRRAQIEPKYAKKIESVVRHGARGGPPAPPAPPCPRCARALPAADLQCAACAADVPMCICTGLHIVKDDLTACPECDYPAIYTEFVDYLKEEGTCPMCNEHVDHRRLRKILDVDAYLDPVKTE